MSLNAYSEVIRWWDKRRLWYNAVVGGIAVFYIIYQGYAPTGTFEIFGALVYGAGANLFYSLGILFELYDIEYKSGRLGIDRFRNLFFYVGTLFSISHVLIMIDTYYFGPIRCC